MISLIKQVANDWNANGRDWTRPGFRALAVHRFGVWRMNVRPKLIRAPLSIVYRALFRHCRNVYGIELPYSARVGQGVVIEHQGGIVVHGASVIGDRSVIRQGCTLGIRDINQINEAPTLGCNVDLGAGCILLGNINIGDGAKIGANAVVIIDVPSKATAVGVPARILHVIQNAE